MSDVHDLSGRHIAFFSWRDTHNPEGGGAERYLEKMADGLVARGARVTILCAAHAAAPPDETVDGVGLPRRRTQPTANKAAVPGLVAPPLGRGGPPLAAHKPPRAAWWSAVTSDGPVAARRDRAAPAGREVHDQVLHPEQDLFGRSQVRGSAACHQA